MKIRYRQFPETRDFWAPVLGRPVDIISPKVYGELSERTRRLEVYNLYCATSWRTSDCYIGISRQELYPKLNQVGTKLHKIPSFRGSYSIHAVQCGLTEDAAKAAERDLIQKCHATGVKRPINNTAGGEVGGVPLLEMIARRAVPLIWKILKQNTFGERWVLNNLGKNEPDLFNKNGKPISFKSIVEPSCVCAIEAAVDQALCDEAHELGAFVQQWMRRGRLRDDDWLTALGYPPDPKMARW